ncbi:hypothetical protein D1641_03925 [Colidextribacter sp. OB.20]|uniref:GerMN domain-containing protein n=1 Tax=Colidextribacter sp. OB.20 TaxID=2304568 RepID=UPI0013683C48|nr:GerMN domain-containing protein [Colidextribacter sp. OB.20]NBI09168.1 hypothetical protein [Colidextribacter sp. OB.20]
MRKRCFSLLLALVLALSACGGEERAQKLEGPVLWFCTSSEENHGSALACEPYRPPESQIEPPEGEAAPNPGDLLEALLAGPADPELVSPFPRGLTLQWWEWDGDHPGNLRVRMSEQYGGLTDISLTLADYCIVLTLSQVDGVETVEIISAGYTVSYRSHQQLSGEEAVLWDELADTSS